VRTRFLSQKLLQLRQLESQVLTLKQSQIPKTSRDIQHAAMTHQEISSLPDHVNTYLGVGRMCARSGVSHSPCSLSVAVRRPGSCARTRPQPWRA